MACVDKIAIFDPSHCFVSCRNQIIGSSYVDIRIKLNQSKPVTL